MRAAFFCYLIDPESDITGFILDWIRALASQVESLEVIALEVKDPASAGLPANVRLHSLGREKGYGRGRLFFNSQRVVNLALGRADFVLCHMMPLYAILAAPLCRLRRKPLFLWYTHAHLDLKLRTAAALADLVFTAEPESMRVATAKKRVVGHGIDTERFRPAPPRPEDGRLTVLSVGRLSPIKRPHLLIEAAKLLKEKNRLEGFRFILAGQAGTPAQEAYVHELKERVRTFGLDGAVEFRGPVPFSRVAGLYQEADCFVSMQTKKNFDKVVLEAMACGLPTVVANPSFTSLLGRQVENLLYDGNRPAQLVERLVNLARQSPAQRRAMGLELREGVRAGHELNRLMARIAAEAASLRG